MNITSLLNKKLRFMKKSNMVNFDVKNFSCSKYRGSCLNCQTCNLIECREFDDFAPEITGSRSIMELFEKEFYFLFDDEQEINSIPITFITEFVKKVVFSTNFAIFSSRSTLQRLGAKPETIIEYVKNETSERNKQLKNLLADLNKRYYLE